MVWYNKTRSIATWMPSAAEGDEIVKLLAPKFQGGLILEDKDFFLYVGVFIGSFFFFWHIYAFWEACFDILELETYIQRSEAQKQRYVALWV